MKALGFDHDESGRTRNDMVVRAAVQELVLTMRICSWLASEMAAMMGPSSSSCVSSR